MFENVLEGKFEFTDRFSEAAKDFISHLLNIDPESRLSSFDEASKHPFFKEIDWQRLEAKEIPVPSIEELLDMHIEYDHQINIENEEWTPTPDWDTLDIKENHFTNFTYMDEEQYI